MILIVFGEKKMKEAIAIIAKMMNDQMKEHERRFHKDEKRICLNGDQDGN